MVLIRAPQLHGCALESSFREGVRREQLRSLARVANNTNMPLEVSLAKPRQARPSRPSATPRQEQPVRPCRQDRLLGSGLGPRGSDLIFHKGPASSWSLDAA